MEKAETLSSGEVMSAFARFFANERNRVIRARFDDRTLKLAFADGRILSVPLERYPFLRDATDEQRRHYEIGPLSITWEDLDDGIDLVALMTGVR